jgi:hypothetical protein
MRPRAIGSRQLRRAGGPPQGARRPKRGGGLAEGGRDRRGGPSRAGVGLGSDQESSRTARPAGPSGRGPPRAEASRPTGPAGPDRRASDSRHRPQPCHGPKIGSGHCPHARREDRTGTARRHPATQCPVTVTTPGKRPDTRVVYWSRLPPRAKEQMRGWCTGHDYHPGQKTRCAGGVLVTTTTPGKRPDTRVVYWSRLPPRAKDQMRGWCFREREVPGVV